jgi:uncharacterized protein YigE (DUF2233 family)
MPRHELLSLACTVTAFIGVLLAAAPAQADCRQHTIEDARYVICTFQAGDDIAVFLRDGDGQPFGSFGRLRDALGKRRQSLAFAMNGGMYHEDRSPVGLHVENGQVLKKLSHARGGGNFGMTPNGVFWVDGKSAGVTETKAFARRKSTPRFATQSGPMLVIDGKLHPRFKPGSAHTNRRNGVGIAGRRVVFIISDTPVTLHAFARVFRDVAKTPNALYLDGSISRLYAPALGRNDFGLQMGPIVGVTVPASDRRDGKP